MSVLNCSGFLVPLSRQLCQCNASLAELTLALAAAPDPGLDPCEEAAPASFSVALHVGGVFIILSCSLVGVFLPLLKKCVPSLFLPDYVIALGRTAGTGIVLACALVHMLLPGTEALTSSCLSDAFTVDYTAYSYLFCLLAALMMQAVEHLAGSTGGAHGSPVDPPAATLPVVHEEHMCDGASSAAAHAALAGSTAGSAAPSAAGAGLIDATEMAPRTTVAPFAASKPSPVAAEFVTAHACDAARKEESRKSTFEASAADVGLELRTLLSSATVKALHPPPLSAAGADTDTDASAAGEAIAASANATAGCAAVQRA